MGIPRLNLKRLAASKDGGPFSRDAPSRPLKILVDKDVLAARSDWLAELFLGFKHHPLIDMYSVADSEAPGNFVLGKPDMGRDLLPIRCYHSTGYTDTALWPYHQWVSIASGEAARRQASLGDWINDVTLARASIAGEMDLLVTNSGRMLIRPETWVAEANPMNLPDALAILGLFLRQHSDFTVIQSEGGRVTYDRGLFFWVAIRELLPESWRWFSALVDDWQTSKDESLLMLGQSTLQRFDRSLRARDQVHLQMVVPHNNDTADEAMAQLDTILLFLSGAFDASAQVAHVCAGLPRSRTRDAGWHRGTWLQYLTSAAPAFKDLVGVGTTGHSLLQILAALRNSIHGQALQTVGFKSSITSPTETLIRLPVKSHGQLLAGIQKLGGNALWGVRDLSPDMAGLEADTFADSLIRSAVNLMNLIIKTTPLEQLPGVNPSTLSSEAPSDEVFAVERRQAVSALLGI